MLGHNVVGDTVWYRPEVNTLWWLMVALIAVITMSQLKNRVKEEDKEMGEGETPWVNQGLKPLRGYCYFPPPYLIPEWIPTPILSSPSLGAKAGNRKSLKIFLRLFCNTLCGSQCCTALHYKCW